VNNSKPSTLHRDTQQIHAITNNKRISKRTWLTTGERAPPSGGVVRLGGAQISKFDEKQVKSMQMQSKGMEYQSRAFHSKNSSIQLA